MRSDDKLAPPPAFVPKLSINRSEESLHDHTNSIVSGNARQGPIAAKTTTNAGGSRGWNAFINTTASDSNHNNNNSRYTNNIDTISGYDQSSPMPHNGSTFFSAGSSRAKRFDAGLDSSRSDDASHGNIIRGYASTRSNNDSGGTNKRNKFSGSGGGGSTFATQVHTRGAVPQDGWRVTRNWLHDDDQSFFASGRAGRAVPRDAGRVPLRTSSFSSLDDSSSSFTSEASASSFEESVLFDFDAEPVVPPGILCESEPSAFAWIRHPRHTIVLSLLGSRGLFLPRYANIVEYHMSEVFLHYIDLCCQGAYFVRYEAKSSPRERFFSIRMLPRDITAPSSRKIPYLVWTMHRTGVQLVGCVPLEQLVGITINTRSASFHPQLLSLSSIIGPRVDKHRVKLPTKGAFSLWFTDRLQGTATSVDILTCNTTVFDIWTRTFKGLVSVNSSSVVQVPLTDTGGSAGLEKMTKELQPQVKNGP
ncbi:hypothetical protein TraAM80_04843 [Trypanosoma rangeli]|uniref:PH-like domain-containing protein n=1 Tax=Trypanosoma rangeli TaxID=5698 RepID=A0A3R7KC26_TRYRA|nr:uncharacterized protein TraAM80_04843 [Trypanosoma rangeli]RNF05114.1 hypothetical protein TraAM80_04843 [Trypanosoma rangeli]|eukprot:RNF05114.1 hypothetical protein TraAM80_04843 [Trypanosoma rangeli]